MTVFTRIVNGEIPARIVYDDDRVLAFHDVSPKAPTHVLVVPKVHQPSVAALAATEPAALADVVAAAHAVAEKEGLGSGYRLVFNTGPDAQQSIFHVHGHVLGGRQMGWPPG